jgi:hypothetical protein
MISHWRIRYLNRDEYITIHENGRTQLEQVILHCIKNKYALAEVFIVEKSVHYENKNLADLILLEIKNRSMK